MLKIKESKPWIMWPNKLVSNFIDFPANRIFDYDGDFKFTLTFELPHPIERKSTLFAKLPTYFGVDLEQDGFTLIYTEENKPTTYRYFPFKWECEKKYKLCIMKNEDILSLYLDDMLISQESLPNGLGGDENSHIIFGAGNFPNNGFNLNYLDVNLLTLHIDKDDEKICDHHFERYIMNKYFDHTNNCNFINQI